MPPELSHSPFFDKAPSVHRRVPNAVSEADWAYWSERVADYNNKAKRSRSLAREEIPRRNVRACVDAQSPCLDYCAECETLPPGRPKWSTFPTRSGKEWNVELGSVVPRDAPKLAKVANRVRVFPSGEVEVRTVSRASSSKPPVRAYGARWSRGVSGHGRRVIRRACAALVAREPCQVALYSLLNYRDLPDYEFNKKLHSFLAWGRKYLPDIFKYYVVTTELHARGVLHAHMLLFKRIPKGLWRRMRNLWADKYDMGPGSFDVKAKFRKASRAAAYICKYMTDKNPIYRPGLDAEGMLSFEPWRVGRNGQSYERIKFRGNAYRVSDALRVLALPIAEYHLPWGSPLALKLSCNLRGGVRFFDSQAEALAWVSSNLPSGP